MRRLLVLGAGTAGTMVVNRLRHRLARADWQISVVEPSDTHYYQRATCSCRSARTARGGSSNRPRR